MPSRSREPLTIEHVLALLAATPPRLAALTAGLTPVQLQTSSTPGEWSANEVLAHLRACGDVWGNYIATILAEDTPTLRGVNPRAWMKKTNYRTLAFQPSLGAFTTQRAELLAVLEPLPPEVWARTAMVSDSAGRVFERTALFYAQWLARHERPHLKQIERIVTTLDGTRT